MWTDFIQTVVMMIGAVYLMIVSKYLKPYLL
jgi:Na+/proline symporter